MQKVQSKAPDIFSGLIKIFSSDETWQTFWFWAPLKIYILENQLNFTWLNSNLVKSSVYSFWKIFKGWILIFASAVIWHKFWFWGSKKNLHCTKQTYPYPIKFELCNKCNLMPLKNFQELVFIFCISWNLAQVLILSPYKNLDFRKLT